MLATQEDYQVSFGWEKSRECKASKLSSIIQEREELSNKTNKLCSANYLVEKLQMSWIDGLGHFFTKLGDLGTA